MKQKKTKKERQQYKKENAAVKYELKQAADEAKRKHRENKFNLLFIAVIFAVGIFIYSNSFDCSFHFDDDNIFRSSVTSYTSTIGDWLHLFPSRPIGTLTFALNYHFYHLDVWGYHLINLIIHLTNAFLVWWLTWLSLSTPVMKDTVISRHKTMVSFLTGLLFVSHPLATQSVTYIAQRFASLATLFYLLSMILFVKGRLWQGNKNIPWFLFGGSIVCAVLGMLTKEIVFTLPFAIILYEFCFLKTIPWKFEIKDKSIVISFIIFVIFILLFFRGSFSLNIFDTVQPNQGYNYSISWKEYFLTQFSVITTYLRLFIVPINQNFDYDYPLSHSLFEPATFLSFLLLIGILVAAIILFRRYRFISFGIFWFFLTISVESSIIPISQNVIFEHRTYLPSFGFILALTSAFFYFFKERYLKIAVIIILMIAAFNVVSTYQRNKVWKSESTLWTDCLKKSPNKARPHNNLGVALYAEGKYQDAISQYKNALKISPLYDYVHYNLANALKDQGSMEEALKHFQETLLINPNFPDAHNNIGIILEKYFKKYDKAIYHYEQELRINNNPGTHFNFGIALAKKGEIREAIAHFRQAIYLKPDYEQAREALKISLDMAHEQKR